MYMVFIYSNRDLQCLLSSCGQIFWWWIPKENGGNGVLYMYCDQIESHSENLLYLYQLLHGMWDDSEIHKVTAQLNGDKVG